MSIFKYSNPVEAQRKLNAYMRLVGHKQRPLYISNRASKKYYVINQYGKRVHFGQMGYEDYTKHKDEERRKRYRLRAITINGKWQGNPFSPNNLSIHVLW